eukprot:SAG11_NODE_3432_length_2450_cov_2.080391_4_plen_79_part_00
MVKWYPVGTVYTFLPGTVRTSARYCTHFYQVLYTFLPGAVCTALPGTVVPGSWVSPNFPPERAVSVCTVLPGTPAAGM